MYNKLGLLLQWRLAQWNSRNVNYLTNSFVLNTISCSSRPAVLGKKTAQKNFAKIYTVKHLWWSFFLTKLQAWELFSCEFCKMFKNNYFDGHLQMAASGMTWKKKTVSYSSKPGQAISTIWRSGKKQHLFNRISPSGCFWIG